MRLRNIYLVLCVLGTILPYSQFIQFLLTNGPDIQLIFQQLFASNISSFFALDVIVSAIVLVVFIFAEGKRLVMQNLWIPLIATFTVGVSLGLPLFLYMRDIHLENIESK